MIKHTALQAAFILSLASNAWAQSGPEVQINMDVLDAYDEIYSNNELERESKPAPKTKQHVTLPKKIYIDSNVLSGERIDESLDILPVFTFSSQTLNPADIEPASGVEGGAASAKKNIVRKKPPLPPKRPKTFHASKSFIEKARYKAIHGATVKLPKAEQSDILNDLSSSLHSLTAKEVLASIEGSAAPIKRPAPAQLTTNRILAEVIFEYGETNISRDMQEDLRSNSLKHMNEAKDTRIELHAFSSKHGSNGINGAKHIALARALELKSFLKNNNIDESRIDVFPHGFDANNQEHDLVNIQLKYVQ